MYQQGDRVNETADQQATPAAGRRPDPGWAFRAHQSDGMLELQRVAGNRAVLQLIGSPVVQRAPKVAETMMQEADEAEAAPAEWLGALPRYRPSSIADEIKRIKAQADGVRSDQTLLEQALEAKAKPGELKDPDGRVITALLIKPEMKQGNDQAIRNLDRIVEDTQNNSDTLEAFHAQLGNLDRDQARLLAQMTTYAGAKNGKGTFNPSRTAAYVDPGEGAKIGEREVASTGVVAGEFRGVSTGKNNPVAAHQGRAEAAGREMRDRSGQIGTLYGEFRGQLDATRGKVNAIEKVAAEGKIENTQGQLAKLRDRSSAARDMISQIGGLVSNILGFTGWAREPTADGKVSGDTRAAAGNIFTGAMMIAFDLVNRAEHDKLETEIKGLETEIAGLRGTRQDLSYKEALDNLNRERQLLVTSANKVVNAQGELERAQHEYRESMSDMGAAADKSGGKGRDRFEVIAQLLSEADAFEAQAAVVNDYGMQYLRRAPRSDKADTVIKHWPVRSYPRTELMLVGSEKPTESHVSFWRQAEAARRVESAVKELAVQRKEMLALAAELREVFESRPGKS
jgi:hypothetical protein